MANDAWLPDGLDEPWKQMIAVALRMESEKRLSDVRNWLQIEKDWRAEEERLQRAKRERKQKEEDLEIARQQKIEFEQKQREAGQKAKQLERELKKMGGTIPLPKPTQRSRRAGIAAFITLVVLIAAAGAWTLMFKSDLANLRKSRTLPNAEPDSGSLILDNGVKLEMVKLPGGQFMMGSNDSYGNVVNRRRVGRVRPEFMMGSNDSYGDERPPHQVTVASFAIGKYEVTQAQWKAVMGSDDNPSYFHWADDLPVENVSWYQAKAFCDKLNEKLGLKGHPDAYRLPTEAEWEYAARAGSTTKYSFGDDSNELHNYAWFRDNSDYKMQARQTHRSLVKTLNRPKIKAKSLFAANGSA